MAITLDGTSGETLSGNLVFSSTAQRITGDFSNATIANRVAFQTSTTNGVTTGFSLPNGTGVASGWRYYNNSDITNASFGTLFIDSSQVSLVSSISGTGSYLPMTFLTGGSERMRIDTSGNVGIGVTPSAWSSSSAIQMAGGQGYSRYGITNNSYYDGTNYRYINTAAATLYGNDTGSHLWFTAPSGTAGNAITFTQAMTLSASGNLGIGTSSPTYKFEVKTTGQNPVKLETTTTGQYDAATIFLNTSGSSSNQATVFYHGIESASDSSNTTFQIQRRNNTYVYLDTQYLIDYKYNFQAWYTNAVEKMRLDTNGNLILFANTLYQYQPAPTSKAAAATLTGAELMTGILNTTGTSYTITVPTGTNIDAAVSSYLGVNGCFDWWVINTASGTITIAANSNTTMGGLTVATGTSAQFRFRKTAANTYTIYRLG